MMDVQPDYKLNTLKQLKNPVRQFNAVRLKSRFFGGFFGSLSGCTLAILLLFSVPFVQNARGQNRVGETLTRDSVAATYSEETSLSDSLDRSAPETPTGVSETVLSGENDTIPALSSDSLQVVPDSLANEEGKAGGGLEGINAVVEYQAEDSLIFDAGGMGRLYKQGQIVYEDLNLEADYIQMSMDSSLIYASGIEDSTGTVIGSPVFKDTSGEYISKNLKYNFNTRRGIINQVVTQQGEGYVVSGLTKKMEDDALYMVDGKYTTCEDHDNPHFYLQLSKAKVRPKKNIVAGPAHLVVEDVHLPLFIPFGFFPFTESYSSGIITPTYGDELSRGFYLKDGGYYFAISDYIDLALTGELYSKGSWGGRLRTNYRKRYKFSGALNASYLVSVTSERNLPDYAQSKNLSLTWSHSQDPKANPFRSFSASVNFATSGYSRNDIASYYNPEVFS
ncbi:MAG: LPS-assembly protein LptD, partial [Bacteroidales bacterium]|nr:LPS-assembly protein LptD [Bacteroidales bacterium]